MKKKTRIQHKFFLNKSWQKKTKTFLFFTENLISNNPDVMEWILAVLNSTRH